MTTLQDYLTSTRRLLHDASAKYYTDSDLTAYINTACNHAVVDSTCYRVLQVIYLSTGVEQYVYGGVTGCQVASVGSGYTGASTIAFSAPPSGVTATGTLVITNGTITDVLITNTGNGYLTAPTAILSGPGVGAVINPTIILPNTMDVMNLTIDWGQTRLILNRMSFTEFQSSVRAWVNYQQKPGIWTKYGQSTIFVGPIPDQTYLSEWDTVLMPPQLANYTDVSVIGYPYSDPVPYYAAHIAKINEQSFDESDRFLLLYQQKMRHALRAVMMRQLPSGYGS